MKSLIVTMIILAFAVLEAGAQYKESYGYVGVSSGRVALDGKRLSLGEERVFMNEIFGKDIYKEFVRNRRAYHTGLSFVVTGGIVFATSAYFHWVYTIAGFMFYNPKLEEVYESLSGMAKTTGYIMIGGLAMIAAGIPTLCVYRSRMRDCIGKADASKRRKEFDVALGGTPSGLGLTLSF